LNNNEIAKIKLEEAFMLLGINNINIFIENENVLKIRLNNCHATEDVNTGDTYFYDSEGNKIGMFTQGFTFEGYNLRLNINSK
jgi:outer membrane protease